MTNTVATTEETMPKKDFQQVQLQEVTSRGGQGLALKSFAELEKFSHFMAMSNFMPKHLRGKQADCLAVLLQSMRWEMDPFAVAQKTYFVNDGMAYEAQLVNAIVNSRAPLKGRLRLEWAGEGENLTCTASGIFIGEDEPHTFTAELKTITTRNSPLWKQQTKQQLGYFASRAWARLYCPDVLMGVYTKDEIEDNALHYGPDNAINITPANQDVIDSIAAGIQAEKASAEPVPQSESTHATGHDPETGEVTTGPAIPALPPIIKLGYMPEDATKPDWETFSSSFIMTVDSAPDEAWLARLMKDHGIALNSLSKFKPELRTQIEVTHQNKLTSFSQAEAA